MPTQRKNRQQRTLVVNDEPTGPDSMIWEVVRAVPSCLVHSNNWADTPCHDVQGLTGRRIVSVCNDRAKRAGFNHPISPEALRGRVQPKY